MLNDSCNKQHFNTWDEAFKGLAPLVRQESIRVAEYTRALYVQAVKSGFYADSEKWQERMHNSYDELAYKCGLYHQLGKAYLPQEFQCWRNDFTQEQFAEYEKYTTDGAQLVEYLQTKNSKSFGWGRNRAPQKVENIPDLMIMESCSMHMERYNGTGYPAHLSGDNISPIAYIVGLAKEFDRIATGIKSENPFDEAFLAVTNSTDAFPPELVNDFKKVKLKFKEIFEKYIQYSNALTNTVPLVDKREDRPMGLAYRAVVDLSAQKPIFYFADSWFGIEVTKTETDKPGNTLAALFKRRGILAEVCRYFLYEACDTVMRTENCKLGLCGIIFNIFPEFYGLTNQTEMFGELFRDQPVDKNHLFLTVPENVVINSPKSTIENIKRYISNGINIILTDYHPGRMPVEKIQEYGFKYVIPAKELYGEESLAKDISMLHRQGIGVICGEADTAELIEWVKNTDALGCIDAVNGVSVNEETIIREGLASENTLI